MVVSSGGTPDADDDALRVAGESLAEKYLIAQEFRGIDLGSIAKKVFFAIVGVFAFILGIQLMKGSAIGLAPALEDILNSILTSPTSALGLGWLVSYLVLSGSPVAAVALSFFDAQVLDLGSAYLMIMGSRFGASFIVIVIGLVAIARGGGREESLSMGVLSFLVTYSVYIPSVFLGLYILSWAGLSWLTISTPPALLDGINLLYGPMLNIALNRLPLGLVFGISFLSLYAGLSLFDRAFHRGEVQEVEVSALHRLLEVPIFSFVLGAGITLLSTSVSLSLGMLVPLYLKGYLRRRDVVPYIMGANITTFVDTLLVAVLLGNSQAINLVLVSMLSVGAVSLLILLLYRAYGKGILWLFHWTFHSNRALIGFVVIMVASPVVLLVI